MIDTAPLRVALVATSQISEITVSLLQDSVSVESDIVVLNNITDAHLCISSENFDIAFVDFSIGGPQAFNLIQDLSKTIPNTPFVLLVDRYRQSLDSIVQKVGALDWIDRRDVGGPLFDRCLRYVFTKHALQQQLAQREIDLKIAQEIARNAEHARTEFFARLTNELRASFGEVAGLAKFFNRKFLPPIAGRQSEIEPANRTTALPRQSNRSSSA